MERDFFGLSSKNGAGTVKEDSADKIKDPASVRGAGFQWSFSNKVSALPQLLSFKAIHEDRPRKTTLDPLALTGYMTTSTVDGFVSNQKPFFGVNATQRNFPIGKQAGNKHGMKVYSVQRFDAHSACPQEAGTFSVSNQSNLAITGQNMVNSSIKSHPVGGLPLMEPVSFLPSCSSMVGTTDLRNSSNSSAQRAQLTIFYAGSVCVYDDISPEKAQAIMLLAKNESTPIQNNTVSTAKLHPPISMPSKDDGLIISKSYSSPMPSPLSVTSQVCFHPGGRSSSNNEMRSIGSSATPPSNHLYSNVGSVGSAATKMVPRVGLPQARKASLARFLQKRKERVVSTSPYFMSMKSPECSTPDFDGFGFSINFPGSSPIPSVN